MNTKTQQVSPSSLLSAPAQPIPGVDGTPARPIVGSEYSSAVRGGAGQDFIIGSQSNYLLDGGNGDDIIDGSSARRGMIKGGAGNDFIFARHGRDFIDGGDGDDLIYAGTSAHAVQNNVIWGGAGNDRIFASAGHDTIDGGSGDDRVQAGDGDDRITDLSGSNILHGEAGNDVIQGNGFLYGGQGADVLVGSGELYGGDDSDQLFGAGIMAGGRGEDVMVATDVTSADTYLWNRGDGHDTITDFGQAGKQDTLVFGPDIAISSLALERTANDLVFVLDGRKAVTVKDWFVRSEEGNNRIEIIRLADGTAWNAFDMVLEPYSPPPPVNPAPLIQAMASFAPAATDAAAAPLVSADALAVPMFAQVA